MNSMLPQFIQQSQQNYYNSQLPTFYQAPQQIVAPPNSQPENTPANIQIQEANQNQLPQEQKPKLQSPFQISHHQQPKAHNHVGEIINQKNKEAIEELQEQMSQFIKHKDQNSNLKFDQNQNYFEESCKLFIRNSMLSQKVYLIKEVLTEKNEIITKITEIVEKENESQQSGEGNQNSEKKKRYRRSAIDIKRHYKCPVPNCEKSYGSEGSLSQHLKLKHPDYHCSTKSFSKKIDNDEENKIDFSIQESQEEQNIESQNFIENKNHTQEEELQKVQEQGEQRDMVNSYDKLEEQNVSNIQ